MNTPEWNATKPLSSTIPLKSRLQWKSGKNYQKNTNFDLKKAGNLAIRTLMLIAPIFWQQKLGTRKKKISRRTAKSLCFEMEEN